MLEIIVKPIMNVELSYSIFIEALLREISGKKRSDGSLEHIISSKFFELGIFGFCGMDTLGIKYTKNGKKYGRLCYILPVGYEGYAPLKKELGEALSIDMETGKFKFSAEFADKIGISEGVCVELGKYEKA